jgi:hypothetical protein
MQEKAQLKIGLLVDAELASTYTYELAEWGQRQSNVSISTLIIQGTQPPKTGRLAETGKYTENIKTGHLLARSSFKLLRNAEGARLSRNYAYKNHLQRYDLRKAIPKFIYVESKLSQGNDLYSEEDIRRIKSLNLDLIVMCGSGSLRGEILKSSRLGILALQYGDAEAISGGAPGFWETLFQRDMTEFKIVQSMGDPAHCNVLMRGRLPTKHYYLLNEAALYKRSLHYLLGLLNEFAVTGGLPAAKETCPQHNGQYAVPGLRSQSAYVFKQAVSLVNGVVTRLFYRREDRWGLAFARTDWKALELRRANRIQNRPDHFLADPFVISQDGRDFCFAEDYDFVTRRGCIAAYELKDKTAERLGDAIVEPFHMSFPYLFRFEGKLYMCPETSENGDIRLYECANFPLQWRLTKILMTNVAAVDTMIFEKDGLWWLLTNIDPLKLGDYSTELSCFYAPSPLATDWTPHKRNPILIDSSKGRNGGLLSHQGSIYRVAQNQGFGRYGRSISINRIETLTKEDYSELKLYSVEPDFFPNIEGIHHMHSNNSVSVFDCLEIAAPK